MNRWMPWIAGAAVVAAAVGLAVDRSHRAAADAGPAKAAIAPAADVAVATVERRELPLVLQVVGRIEALSSVAVKARMDGQVAEVAYQEGRPVRKGQLLVRLDDSVLQSQLKQAEAVTARDEALLEKSRADLRRSETLLAQGFVSTSAVDQARSAMHADEAALRADAAATQGVRLQLQFTRIASPIDGTAGIAQLTMGGAAKANDTTLVVVDQVDPVYATFSLPESRLAPLRAAMRLGAVAAEATVTGASDVLRGRVAFLDNAVDTTTGAITGKAVFANRDALLTPGQFADVRLRIGALPAGPVVPATAVESATDGSYLFVVDGASQARLRPVKVIAESGGWSVVDGVAAGDRVVVLGQEKLRDKAPVRVMAAASSAPSGGSAGALR